MSTIDRLLDDFTKDNIILWLKEVWLFFTKPRRFVSTLKDRPIGKLIPQYCFYFVIYSFSILLLQRAEIKDLYITAIASLSSTLIIIGYFTFTSYLATRRNFFREIFCFIFSANLFLSPLIFLFLYQFFQSELYVFKFVTNCIICIYTIVVIVIFPFFITFNRKLSFRIFASSYLGINLIWIFSFFFNSSTFTGVPSLVHSDPITEEYRYTYGLLQTREVVPTHRVFFLDGDSVRTVFLTQNLVDTSHTSSGSLKGNSQYVSMLKDDINFLKSSVENVRFLRTRYLVSSWLEYYSLILNECERRYDFDEVTALIADSIAYFDEIHGTKRLMMEMEILPIIGQQLNVKTQHNEIAKLSRRAEIPLVASYLITRLIANIISTIYIDHFQNMKPKPVCRQTNLDKSLARVSVHKDKIF